MKRFKEFISLLRNIMVIIVVIVGMGSLYYAYRTVSLNHKLASANYVLQISNKLDKQKYNKVLTAIEDHSSNYQLRKSKCTDDDIENYIGNFETVGNLIDDGIIDIGMAYDELGYDAEKAWCNRDVQKVISEARTADKLKAGPRAFYAGFENFAKYSLSRDKKTCKEMDKE